MPVTRRRTSKRVRPIFQLKKKLVSVRKIRQRRYLAPKHIYIFLNQNTSMTSLLLSGAEGCIRLLLIKTHQFSFICLCQSYKRLLKKIFKNYLPDISELCFFISNIQCNFFFIRNLPLIGDHIFVK